MRRVILPIEMLRFVMITAIHRDLPVRQKEVSDGENRWSLLILANGVSIALNIPKTNDLRRFNAR